MWKFWIGFIFILIDVDASLAGHQLSCVPDFIGYVCLLWALCSYGHLTGYFKKNRVIAGVMIVMNLLKVGANLTGYFSVIPKGYVVLFAMNLIEMVAAIYLSYSVLKGFEEVAQENEWSLYTKRTRASWKMITIVQLVSPLSMVVKPWALMLPLVVIITSLIFIRDLKNTCDAYKVAAAEREEANHS